MTDLSLESLTRNVADGISRRATLVTLGAAGLAAIASPFVGAAKKKHSKKNRAKKNGIGEKAKQRCQQQVDQCFDFTKADCEGDANCLETALRCCPVAGNCDVIGFLFCIEEE